MAAEQAVGLLGATSLVGQCLSPMLIQKGFKVVAYSRRTDMPAVEGMEWRSSDTNDLPPDDCSQQAAIACWICVAPIWVLPEYFKLLQAAGAKRVVALSSTSRFSKDHSSDMAERKLAQRLTDAETRFQTWASGFGIEWVILRPTLIYGLGQDKNIAEIVRVIRRFGIFPLFGKAKGLRQPIHAEDVANACLAALHQPSAANRGYNISGGETISYRDMVCRVFSALGLRSRLLSVPLWAFRLAMLMLRCLPRYRHWSTAMAERMNNDLVFHHDDATRDLGFKPRAFVLASEDLPT